MSDVKIHTTAEAVISEEAANYFRLKRGESVDLSKLDPTLNRIMVGVGWDVIGFDSEAPDLDASLLLLDKAGMTRFDEDFIFYNNLKSLQSEVEHMGDNRTGAGDGDDENILIDLMALSFDVDKIPFVISIYDADVRGHTFQHVRNCFLRILNDETGIELMRINLDKELAETEKATALVVGHLERSGVGWSFVGTGDFTAGGLREIVTKHGILVAL